LPRFLALDWDNQQLHVVSATLRAGRAHIERALASKEQQSPNPAEAEALGRLLRERLKSAGIAAAPVLACIGRDRVILKEVRYPPVPAHEEPAVVQFQVSKELTDAADEVVLDYMPLPESGRNGEQHALAFVIRRELLSTYETLSKAAGLKLVALTPRPIGMLACWKQLIGSATRASGAAPDAAVALLTVEEYGAEFCIVHGDRLLLARSLAAGTTLAGEVRRSLAVYAAHSPPFPVHAVYVAGGEEHAPFRARLQDLLGIPVQPMDPFGGVDRVGIPLTDRGGFVSAAGLLYARALRTDLPVNFAQPKKPKPPSDVKKIRLITAGAAAALLLIGTMIYSYSQLNDKQQRVDSLYLRKVDLEKKLAGLEEDDKRIALLEDWNQSGIVWLDELYDLTVRFPDTETIRLTSLRGDPVTHTAPKTIIQPADALGRNTASKQVAKLTLNGITAQVQAVKTLNDRFVDDAHYHVDAKQTSRNTGPERGRFQEQFIAHIEIEKPTPDKYVRRLPEDNGAGGERRFERRRDGSGRRGGRGRQ
jgi:Tfp pilus assembly PilM family ATPase